MKTFFQVMGGVLAGLALMAVVGTGITVWRYVTAEWHGRVDAEVQIESAPSRITNYEHYFDLCASVQGYEAALLAQRSLLGSSSGREAERTRANIAGIAAQRARVIAQYNADAAKSYTRARFLGDSLPRRLEINTENTQCAQ